MPDKSNDVGKKLVVKANRLIEAKGRLSVLEQRILLAAIAQIQPKEEELNEFGYPLNIKEFRDTVGLKGKGYYSEVKEVTIGLVGKGIVIHEEDGDLQTSWLSSAKYHDQAGIVYLNFDPRLKPYLLKLKNSYTSYQLKYVIKLKSKYAIRIYELLKQYEKIGSREFAIDEFRAMVGIKVGKYTMFGDLNRNVLKKAQKEMLETTDIKFIYKTKKTGRKVTGLVFTIRSNQAIIDEAKKNSIINSQIKQIIALVPKKEQDNPKVERLIKKHLEQSGFDYVKWNVLYVNSRTYKSYVPYLAKALSFDYGKSYQTQLFAEEEARTKQMESLANEELERKAEIQKHDEWVAEKKASIEDLSEVEQEDLYNKAIKSLSKKLRKNPKTIDRDSYMVFLEAAMILEGFEQGRVEV
jgi:plasmid replication initiation protein